MKTRAKDIFPIGTKVRIVETIVQNSPSLGQIGTVISYSGHGMICVNFPGMQEGSGIYFNQSSLKIESDE